MWAWYTAVMFGRNVHPSLPPFLTPMSDNMFCTHLQVQWILDIVRSLSHPSPSSKSSPPSHTSGLRLELTSKFSQALWRQSSRPLRATQKCAWWSCVRSGSEKKGMPHGVWWFKCWTVRRFLRQLLQTPSRTNTAIVHSLLMEVLSP